LAIRGRETTARIRPINPFITTIRYIATKSFFWK
jgi:hypothetical protein